MKQNGQFLLFTREEFKDWLFKTKFTRQIKLIQNHHTYLPDYKSFNGKNHFDLLINMKNYHISSANKMSDIAQNLTTFKDGTIAVCRSFEKIPAGIYGANTGALCIEHVGNFDKGCDNMTEEHKQTILFLNAVLCMKFNLSPTLNTIVYHHWYDLNTGKRTNGTGATKTCPGTNFFGGNTIDSFNKNFLPLINNKIKELTVKEILDMFNDFNKVADYAKPSVERMEKLGLIKGDEKNNYRPLDNISRQDFAVVIDRLLKLLGK